jgi:nitrate/nitrite-specific signal transduction histidine kinase
MTEPDRGQQKGPPAGKAKRSIKNYFLQPLLQVKLGMYCIILSVLFAVGLGVIIYLNFAELVNSVVLMTDLEEDVRDLFLSYWKSTQIWVYLVFIVYLLATILVSVLYTHRLVGPTIAFKRHIRSLNEDRFNARTYLRKGDAFGDVADELNRLSEKLEKGANG